jgi:hypothetical protein
MYRLALITSLALACSPGADDTASSQPAPGSSTGPGGPAETGTTGPDAGTTGPVDPTTGAEGEVGSSGADPTTGGGGGNNECDPWAQDCPEGEKCAAWASDMSEHWDSTRCVPVVADPALPGEPCVIEEWVASGIDDCEKGSFCWYMDYVTLAGVCVPACAGSEDAPVCPDMRACDISNDGTLLLCLEACDPLVPSCPDGQLCFSSGEGNFICDLDNSGDGGAYGDPCAFVNSCNYGLFCAYPEEVPGCDNGEGCCSEFCDVSAMENTCAGAPEQTCLPWFNDGEAPPGLEDVGYCTVPQ